MTKPLVDAGIFRKIGDCPTPWPCFVIAVRDEILEKNPKVIDKILETINKMASKFKEIPNINKTLASRYNLKVEDIEQWLTLTDWSQKQLDVNTLNKVQNQLFELSLIDKKVTFETLVR